MGAWAQAIADLTGGVRSYKDWIGVPGKQDGQEKSTRLLDFACGPGTISHVSMNGHAALHICNHSMLRC